MEIKFYILQVNQMQQAWLFACSCIESFYRKQQHVDIIMNHMNDAERFDQLLWTYRDDSFLPHTIFAQHKESDCPILILPSAKEKSASSKQVLINLSDDIPEHYQAYQQLIEIVYNEPSQQQHARMRYKKYRDNGHQIQTIKHEDAVL